MTLTVHAPAKINLTLEILGRRPDGYHELRSVMQAISLHDTLTLETAEPGHFTLCGGNGDAPPTEDNLVLKAARALDAATGGGHGARIALEKRIPVGAGLGGGSSDAATTLLALNDLWKTGMSVPELTEIAAGLGSDVPFFLTGGTALIEGRGERVTSLASLPGMWLALAQPAVSLSTPAVYAEYANDLAPFGMGDGTRVLAGAVGRRALAAADIAATLRNDLQPAAIRLCPEIAMLQAAMTESGALGTLVCGSGSAVFALATEESHARGIVEAVKGHAAWTAVAHSVALPMLSDEEVVE